MADLTVSLGASARTTLRDAFAHALRSIDVQFHNLDDATIVDSLNDAARRGVAVTVHVEGDRGRYDHRNGHVPDNHHVRSKAQSLLERFDARVHWIVEADPLVLEHGKAAVVDGTRGFVATANANGDGFEQPGEVLVEDDAPDDVGAIEAAIGGRAAQSARVISGPDPQVRSRISGLLAAPRAERIAVEDLSDPETIAALIARKARGLEDEVLVKVEPTTNTSALGVLKAGGVSVRALAGAYMHDKYIDAGDRIYIGSANLTRNGLDEAREIGIVAPAADFTDGGAALRAGFDRMWAAAVPV